MHWSVAMGLCFVAGVLLHLGASKAVRSVAAQRWRESMERARRAKLPGLDAHLLADMEPQRRYTLASGLVLLVWLCALAGGAVSGHALGGELAQLPTTGTVMGLLGGCSPWAGKPVKGLVERLLARGGRDDGRGDGGAEE